MRTIATALLLATLAAAQPAPRPEFEVATLHENISGDTQIEGRVLPGGQFSDRNLPLRALIAFAYGLPNQLGGRLAYSPALQQTYDAFLQGAPAWTASTRYDLIGKAPPGAPDSSLALMLQTFLEKEFKLTTHTELRPTDAYALVAGKGGLKLQPTATPGPRACRRLSENDRTGYTCANITLPDLAQLLPSMSPGEIGRAVVDQTNLKGVYDLNLDWDARQDQPGRNIFDALTPLGLKLEPHKLPLPVLVIDHIEKPPAEN